MAHEIDAKTRNLATWEAWARWPNIWRAARAGGQFGAAVVTLYLLTVDLWRVFRGTIGEAHPLRNLLIGAGAILVSALGVGLLCGAIASGIRLVRTVYLFGKRRELTQERLRQADGENTPRG